MRHRRGHNLIELVASSMLLSIAVLGTATLYNVGQRQQKIGRDYSQVQTELRSGLRRALRAVRHGMAVKNPSTSSNFPVLASNASQVIVKVPEPTGVLPATIELRCYVNGGTLYAQRSDEAAPGLALVSGVQSITVNYYRTNAGMRTAVDSTPDQATEVELYLTSKSGLVTSSLRGMVALRNVIVNTP